MCRIPGVPLATLILAVASYPLRAQGTPNPAAEEWKRAILNGTYDGLTFKSGKYADSNTVRSIVKLTIGDLDGDGVEDAAAVFLDSGGGSGIFYSLVSLRNDRGKPVKLSETMLGDRIALTELTISSGQIRIRYVDHGPNDAMCCPSVDVARTFSIRNGALITVANVDPSQVFADSLKASAVPPQVTLSAPSSGVKAPTTRTRGSLTLQFGATPAAFEPLRNWVAGTPAFRRHLEWLGQNIDFPYAVPVVFQACGQANAFYNPGTHSIAICYEYLDKRQRRVRSYLSQATAEQVTDAVLRTTLHVINHEVGHALVHQLNLPVLGREEDAADGFSAFILLERGGPQDAYSVIQGAFDNRQKGFFEVASQADMHSLNDQRFYNLLCWTLGSDPTRFAGFAQSGQLPPFRQERCPSEWKQLQASWRVVLGDRLRPPSGPQGLGPQVAPTGSYSFGIANTPTVSIGAGQELTYRFQLDEKECRVRISTLGLDGGNRDLETLLLDEYNFNSRQSGAYAEALFQSGRVRQLDNIEVAVKGPGRFVFVVSNKFSFFTPKVARVQAAATCSR